MEPASTIEAVLVAVWKWPEADEGRLEFSAAPHNASNKSRSIEESSKRGSFI